MAAIDDILRRLDEVARVTEDQRIKAQFAQLSEQLKSYGADQDAQQAKMRDQIAQDQATITALQSSQTALQAQVTELQAQVVDLQKKLDAEPAVTRAAPGDLVQAFRQLIDQAQADARAGTSEVGVTIKSMDLELKSLIEIEQNQTSLVLPSVKAPIDVGALSTLRLSFGAIPNIQPASAPSPGPAGPGLRADESSEPPRGAARPAPKRRRRPPK